MLLELSDWEVYDPQIRTHLLELAYYYNAISNISRADSLLERVFEIEKVPQKKFNEQFAQKKIIADLAGEKLFNLLEERYYPTMIEIEGSRFKMGGQKENTKKIFPEVMLKDFKIGKYEITEFQYELFLKNNGKTLEDHPKPSWQWYGQSPITNVDWFDAVEYSNWLSLEKGLSPAYTLDKDKPDPNYLRDDVEKNWLVILDTSAYAYRLPTEREWEFAAGGGKDGHDESGHSIYKYSGSDSMEEVAWYWLNGTEATGYHQALPVGLKKPNQLGIHDMSGNAMEWVNDWYEKDYYHKARVNYSTYGPSSGAHRILRGGGWGSKDRSLMQVNTRDYTLPYHWQYVTHVGFRVALQIP
ncbi:MAG: SUMF1/EgtB/PvdO family nonheme iron enzyme [Bacteroidota bacterium]